MTKIVTPTSTETLQTQTDSTDDLYTTSNEFHSMAVAIQYALKSSKKDKELSKQKK